jgi:hypothetical protein
VFVAARPVTLRPYAGNHDRDAIIARLRTLTLWLPEG